VRRADRLFQIVQHLRARRLTTAAQLARAVGTSERTIYRDIRDLTLSGVPVRGEAGVGYQMDRHYDLTPLMFTRDEVEAVVVGVRMMRAFGTPRLQAAAESALNKVALALPRERREEIESQPLYAVSARKATPSENIELVRDAITESRKLRLTYRDEKDQESMRVVRPLALYFWGAVWTLAAWCETRRDFRNFRVDRIGASEMLSDTFQVEPGKALDDFLKAMRARQNGRR
jgi:predicted DNA-binding transcriptional regulator YafY